jgi:hypothetical protein
MRKRALFVQSSRSASSRSVVGHGGSATLLYRHQAEYPFADNTTDLQQMVETRLALTGPIGSSCQSPQLAG